MYGNRSKWERERRIGPFTETEGIRMSVKERYSLFCKNISHDRQATSEENVLETPNVNKTTGTVQVFTGQHSIKLFTIFCRKLVDAR